MNIKLLSKNNIGIAATLVLVIALSQSRMFDVLIDTALGRAILILAILGISYINKIFGVIAILFIIIMFNHSNVGYMEGFADNSKKEESKPDTNLSIQKNVGTTITSTPTGREGFNIIDREGSMLKGKRSNEVPVFTNARNQIDDVEPSDKSVFTSDFSSVI